MQIELTTLPHQTKALESIKAVFDNIATTPAATNYSNPEIDLENDLIYENIKKIQNGEYLKGAKPIPDKMRGIKQSKPLIIDVKMETGTGKTCVYSQLIFELNKMMGFNKFIIAVPTTPIREGTRNFIKSEYFKKYIKGQPDFENKDIELKVFEAQKVTKKKKHFPGAVREYFEGTKFHQ